MQGPNSYQRKALNNISPTGDSQISDLHAGKKVRGQLVENGWIEITLNLIGSKRVRITEAGLAALKLPPIPHPFGKRYAKIPMLETGLSTLPPFLTSIKSKL